MNYNRIDVDSPKSHIYRPHDEQLVCLSTVCTNIYTHCSGTGLSEFLGQCPFNVRYIIPSIATRV